MEKSAKLVVNADDFGFTESVSHGIIKAFKEGIVTSTTLMVNMPAAENAAMLALKNPQLAVGIHFVLTAGRPVSSGVSSLTNLDGSFPGYNAFFEKADKGDLAESEVEKEFRAQLDRFLSFGLTPSHFDSHHHVHLAETIRPVVSKLACEFNVPVRSFDRKSGDSKVWGESFTFLDGFYGGEATTDKLTELLHEVADLKAAELMCHPGFADDELRAIDSYCDMREKELEILTSPKTKRLVESLNIELVNYR